MYTCQRHSNSTLRYLPKRNKNLSTQVHSACNIPSNQKLECSQNKMLVGNKKEETTDTYNNIDETQKHEVR